MTLPSPSIEYFLLCPMLIVFGVAVVGVLVEAFLPRRMRYGAQVTLTVGGFVAAFITVIMVARSIPASGRRAVLGSVAVDRPALFLQGTMLLVAVLAVIFVAERSAHRVAAPHRVAVAAGTGGLDSFTRRLPRCQAATPSTRPSGPAPLKPSSSRY
ncbi:putative nADH-quinone oxidoreductase subunit N 2 [Mycobacterium kansasii 732]|nr:putative nADH-quinone oxidoreductase subunit N 2 [Mycobacterium kansasii 732]